MGEPGADRALVGGVTYVVGMFIITAANNAPPHNSLSRVSGLGETLAPLVICDEMLSSRFDRRN